MAKKSILKRGFKADAERLAEKYRSELKIQPYDPLCAFELAKHLVISVYPATQFLKLENEIQWLSNNCEWSALTMPNSKGKKIILHNPFSSAARQQSDLMHELSHILCEHKHENILHDVALPFGLRNYNVEEEEEAKCLGSTLQLSDSCLLWASRQKLSKGETAAHFNASIEMVTYRMNMAGIVKREYYRNKKN